MICRAGIVLVAACAGFILPFSSRAIAQDNGVRFEVGIVYYADGDSFKALQKETVTQGGRSTYSAKVKGEYANFRLRVDQPQVFRVCNVDPTRYKLFKFTTEKNARTVVLARNNMWTGGSKLVLTEAEIPVKIEPSESNCFTLAPQNSLGQGEFGFSPAESYDAFMFGVGDVKPTK